MALYVFQGATDSSGFAPLSLEGEGLGERGNSLKFHHPHPPLIGGEKENYIFMSISLISIKILNNLRNYDRLCPIRVGLYFCLTI